MRRHYSIKIFGEVQDVGFRWAAKQEADKKGITGLAKNLPDGALYIEAEGEETELEHFVQWCQHGPMHARVAKIEQDERPLKNFSDFQI
jgi:acylphosphatase